MSEHSDKARLEAALPSIHALADALAEEQRQNEGIARAARNLIKAMDSAVPDWRETTLNAGEDGDEVNAAWDELVNAIEGDPE